MGAFNHQCLLIDSAKATVKNGKKNKYYTDNNTEDTQCMRRILKYEIKTGIEQSNDSGAKK